MGRKGQILVGPKKVSVKDKIPYEAVCEALPKDVVKKFVGEMERRGRGDQVSYGCFPTMSGDECVLIMADWIGDDRLFKEDMEMLDRMHSVWLRRLTKKPGRGRKNAGK